MTISVEVMSFWSNRVNGIKSHSIFASFGDGEEKIVILRHVQFFYKWFKVLFECDEYLDEDRIEVNNSTLLNFENSLQIVEYVLIGVV